MAILSAAGGLESLAGISDSKAPLREVETMPDQSETGRASITQQDFSVIQGAVAAIKLMIGDRRVQLSDIAADVGSAYQRFAAGSAADVEAAVKAVTKAKDAFNSRVSSWQRDLRAALVGAPKTFKAKLEGQLNLGTGRAHSVANSFEMLIARLEEFKPQQEEAIVLQKPVQSAELKEAEVEPSARESGAADSDHAHHERIPAIRSVMSENGLVLADVLTDRPTKSGEPADRLIVYRVNNITRLGDVIRDDREPGWMPTEHGNIKRPLIGSVPFAVGGVSGTVAGAYKVNHLEVRASIRSDKAVKRGITLNQQVREGNILYVYLAKREERT
jgi:hypothetical protein